MSLIKYIVSFVLGVLLTLALVHISKPKENPLERKIKAHQRIADSLYYEIVYRDSRIQVMKDSLLDITKLPKEEQDSLIKKWLR